MTKKMREAHKHLIGVFGMRVIAEALFMEDNFAVIMLGGTGQVRGAAIAECFINPRPDRNRSAAYYLGPPDGRIRSYLAVLAAAHQPFLDLVWCSGQRITSQHPSSNCA